MNKSGSVDEILEAAGFDLIDKETPDKVLESALRDLAEQVKGSDLLRREIVRKAAIKHLTVAGLKSPARMVDAALGIGGDSRDDGGSDKQEITPWVEAVNGEELLSEIMNWITEYVVVSRESAVAITLWTAATWFVDVIYFAPILAILSPTKRSGKTLVLDLLHWICRKASLTSGVGVTSAVIFRMNERCQPTFLINEAEKLGGRNADKGIIGFLNQGYRRGGKVLRLREKNGDYEPEEFDAFGFRAVAAIGNLWDTIIDRAVVIPMKRKSTGVKRRRYHGRVVEGEGRELSRRICRFAQDNAEALENIQADTPLPEWLNDHACDNWAPLFSVAQLAGGDWPQKALDAAKALSNVAEDGDRAEQLIHDTRQVFSDKGNPEAIQSGDLVQDLNAIESSPWGDYNKGKGITTHKVAAMFKPFEIRPGHGRDRDGMKIRGYWLKDLEEVFRRYPTPSELGQVGQPNNDRDYSRFQTGTEAKICPTSESPESRMDTGLSHLSHSEGQKEAKPLSIDL